VRGGTEGERKSITVLFADIYGWFTERFDTGDLKDAKAPLEEIRS
jgi:hypothetical protein